jgi:excisionase family DNA binding protein
VTRDTIYKWIAEKNMPAHRIGRPWKFKKDEVDEWIRSGGTSEIDKKGAQS